MKSLLVLLTLLVSVSANADGSTPVYGSRNHFEPRARSAEHIKNQDALFFGNFVGVDLNHKPCKVTVLPERFQTYNGSDPSRDVIIEFENKTRLELYFERLLSGQAYMQPNKMVVGRSGTSLRFNHYQVRGQYHSDAAIDLVESMAVVVTTKKEFNGHRLFQCTNLERVSDIKEY